MHLLRLSAVAAVVLLTGCGPGNPRAAAIADLEGDAARGAILFEQACAECHKVKSARFTARWYPTNAYISLVLDGVPESRMPSFESLQDQEIADLRAYLLKSEP